MKHEEIQAALDRGAWVSQPERSPLQPIGDSTGQAVEDCARDLARLHRLLDADGQLHCWHCGRPCPWHVSLLCGDRCRAEVRRQGDAQRQRERQVEVDRKAREREQSRPVQRVANRRFGDDD